MLVICRPSRMQRLQRRAYIRAEVPPNRIVRASFWLGGRTAEPTGGSPTTPVWSGRVVNLSAGGFQLHTDAAAASDVEIGDAVGVRVVFGMGGQSGLLRRRGPPRRIGRDPGDDRLPLRRLWTRPTKAERPCN